MDSNQLTDSLSAHIALYHSSTPSSSLSPNPRNSILRWFSSLAVHQRQSFLTIVDSKFVEILIQMQSHLHKQGHGFFIILPDLPSRDRPSLPSLCFRRSRGLLSRASASNESERLISRAVLMFGSKEGENLSYCSCSASSLDSFTVSENLVGDLDRLVAAMDGVSDGEFLRGEQRVSGSEWEELPWLKAKGYYSIEAFVANKLEVALRLSWLNCHGGKRRGVKSKEKASAAGVATNVFWRKKGCLDWWTGLDTALRKKIFGMFLSRAAKPLANEIVKGENGSSKDEMEFFNVGAEQPLRYGSTASYQRIINALLPTDAEFCPGIIPASVSGKPASLANVFNGLLVLHEISTMILASQHSEFEKDRLFFSSLGSINCVSDCILRTLRGLLVAVSRDCVNLELLGDENLKLPLNKSIEKSGGNARRGKNKGRNQKRLNPESKSGVADYSLQKPSEEHGCKSACREGNSSRLGYMQDTLSREANGKSKTVNACILEKDLCKEHTKGLVDHKVQITGKKSRKERSRNKNSSLKGPVTVRKPKTNMETTPLSVMVPSESTKSSKLIDAPTVHRISNDSTSNNVSPNSSSCDGVNKAVVDDGTEVTKNIREHLAIGSTTGNCRLSLNCSQTSNRLEDSNLSKYGLPGPEPDQEILHNEASADSDDDVYNSKCYSIGETSDDKSKFKTMSPVMPVRENDILVIKKGLGHLESGYLSSNDSQQNCGYLKESSSQPVIPVKLIEPVASNDEAEIPQKKDCSDSYSHGYTSSWGGTSYEWPSIAPVHFPAFNSQHLPAATDRLHLDVGRNCRSQFHQTFVTTRHQSRNPPIDGGCSLIVPSRTLPMSLDWPPMVRNVSRLSPSLTCNYDSGYVPRLQSSFRSGFTAHGMQLNGIKGEEERKYSGDFMDLCNFKNAQDQADDNESHWISEEEPEVHAFSGRDYNQFFGGGVMYWNTCDLSGTGFSRPPSLSSEDSSWAWHEAELNRAIDDMVGLPASYSASGMASPPAAPFCSPFDPLGPGHQSLGYVIPGNDVAGKVLNSSSAVTDVVPEEKGSSTNSPGGVVEGMTGDSFPYPILSPIVVPNFSRPRSRSEFKINHGHKSPCKLPTRRDPPRIKRPPSPVVLCVPRAPRPPPPSPVSECRKQRGFPTVRSGSSSPRNWGMRSWSHDGTNCDEACLSVDGADVIWPSWGSKGLVATPMIQPLPESLLQDRLIAISQLALDKEHPDVALPLQPPDLLNCPDRKTSLSVMYSILHEEIDTFCKQVAAENMTKKPYINWAVKRVARSLQVLWPRSRTNIFGSTATGLALPTSDVDLVVCLPPVRNLEPIKEAGILEGRNGIKETCLQHAARYLANQEWVKSDSLKTVENTAIPVIMLVAEVPHDLIASSGNTSNVHATDVQSTHMTDQQGSVSHSDIMVSDYSWPMHSKMKNGDGMDMKSVRLDISFKSPSHTGLQTMELVRDLTEQFPAAIPLALVLKQFLADRSLDHSYSGGLSSYCLVLLITRFLQHELHIGRPINQNLGSLLMDFLYFFGNVFDPRQMRISIQGNGVYVNRERGHSIDPIHIDDPLYPTNNVGRNCFRIHQCVKAFADAYSVLENELTCLPGNGDSSTSPSFRLLPKIIPSIDNLLEV